MADMYNFYHDRQEASYFLYPFPVVMTKFNQSVVYNGSQPTMSYAVREPITRGIFSATHTQGTAKQ